MEILRLVPEQVRWSALVAHMQTVGMARWGLDADLKPLPGVYYLAAWTDEAVVGHLSLKRQPLLCPATAWTGNEALPVRDAGGTPLQELFVYTFAVEDAHRRQGYGRALQQAALKLAHNEGCYQVRSWSSADKPANYALKLSLGFAVHPAIYETETGQAISGVYWVKTVR